MVTLTEIRKVFADKLLKTDSFDAAFTKAMWTAYKQGIEDNKNGITIRDIPQLEMKG